MVAPGASPRLPLPDDPTRLARPQWQTLEADHAARVDVATAAHRERRADGRTHPVEDFLFRYYNNSPARLRRWHPGAGVLLRDAAHLPRASWTAYRAVGDTVELDVAAFLAAAAPQSTFVRELLSATVSRPAQLGCFGLHEWAMVHGVAADDVRHAGWPLRLGSAGTDAVVEPHSIRCSHFDAYRFFTEARHPGTRCGPPATARWRWSSRAACTPGWTSTSGRSSWPHGAERARRRRLRPRARDPGARHGGLAVRPRELGYQPVPIETPRAGPPTSSGSERSPALQRPAAAPPDRARHRARRRRRRGPDLAVSARRVQRGSTPARTSP